MIVSMFAILIVAVLFSISFTSFDQWWHSSSTLWPLPQHKQCQFDPELSMFSIPSHLSFCAGFLVSLFCVISYEHGQDIASVSSLLIKVDRFKGLVMSRRKQSGYLGSVIWMWNIFHSLFSVLLFLWYYFPVLSFMLCYLLYSNPPQTRNIYLEHW